MRERYREKEGGREGEKATHKHDVIHGDVGERDIHVHVHLASGPQRHGDPGMIGHCGNGLLVQLGRHLQSHGVDCNEIRVGHVESVLLKGKRRRGRGLSGVDELGRELR